MTDVDEEATGEWAAVEDPDSGKVYYYNQSTGETMWENPYSEQQYDESYGADGSEGYEQQHDPENVQSSADDWIEHYDAGSDRTYYEHKDTHETQWDKPYEDAVPQVAIEEEDDISDEWITHEDPDSGRCFYEHRETHETQWERPISSALLGAAGGAGSELDAIQEGDEESEEVESEWIEHIDAGSGTVYYENRFTQETQWEMPEGFVASSAATGPQYNEYGEGYDEYVQQDGAAESKSTVSMNMSLYDSQGLNLPVYMDIDNTSASPSSATSKDHAEGGYAYGSGSNGYVSAPDELDLDYIDSADALLSTADGGDGDGGGSGVDSASSFAVVIDSTIDGSGTSIGQELIASQLKYHSSSASNNISGGIAKDLAAEGAAGIGRSDGERHRAEKERLAKLLAEALAALEEIQNEKNAVRVSETLCSKIDPALLESLAVISVVSKRVSNFKMESYAEKFYQYDRRGTQAVSSAISKLLSWQSEPIKASLNYLPAALNVEALACFRLILYFMGDKKTSRPHMELALNLVSKMISASQQELQDEVYCQLCKQTRKNSSSESVELGWQLMLICLTAFPPSKRLLPYLLNYIAQALQTVVENAKKFVYFSLKVSLKAATSPVRMELPTEEEIQALLLGEMIEIKVSTIDGTEMSFHVDSYSSVGQLERMVCTRLGVRQCNWSSFSLFEMSRESDELTLFPSARVVDLMSVWKRRDGSLGATAGAGANVAGKMASRDRGEGSHAGSRGKPLSMREHSGSNSSGNGRTPAGRRGVHGSGGSLATTKLLFKVKCFFALDYTTDQVATQLLYIQALHDVREAKYPHTISDAILLAALQLQEAFGDILPNKEVSELKRKSIYKYLCKALIDHSANKGQRAEIELKVVSAYKKLAGVSKTDARQMYLEYVSSWKLYGSGLFVVQGHITSNGSDYYDNDDDALNEIVLAVSASSLVLVDPVTQEFLADYTYSEIFSWGHSFDSFVLVIGSKSSQVKSYFKTSQGKEIDDLLSLYQKAHGGIFA